MTSLLFIALEPSARQPLAGGLGEPSLTAARHGSAGVRWGGLALLLLCVTSRSFALSISPTFTEVWIKPGAEQPVAIQAINDSKEPLDVEVSEKESMGIPVHSRSKSVHEWLIFKNDKPFTLAPGQAKDVELTVRIPKDAKDPEFSGMVSLRYRSPGPSTVTPMISLPVYAFVEGLAKPEAHISDVAMGTSRDELAVAVALTNTGNVHIRPEGNGTVETEAGKTMAGFVIRQTVPVFPNETRPFVGKFPRPSEFVPGRYRVKAMLKSRNQEWKAESTFEVLKDGKIVMDKMK